MAGQQDKISAFFVARMLAEVGFIIALPLAILIFAGHWLDIRLGYKAVFIFVGLIVALAISSFLIYQKIKYLR